MKSHYISELALGARFETPFVLRRKDLRTTRSGERYLALEVADRTGSLPATMFSPGAAALHIPTGSVVKVRGTVTKYRSRKRITVDSLEPVRDYDPADMIGVTARDIGELKERFRELVRGVEDRQLRGVLRAVFGDKTVLESFYACPAAQEHHHACIGGLLEHTVAVASLCDVLAETYESIERDLLVTAALLHDIGKIRELAWGTGIEYTDEGRLLGHVVLGERVVHEAIMRVGMRLDAAVAARLSHLILSHHGELEWGAPKRPATLEALVLHHADNLDAKAAGFIAYASGALWAEENWTDADNMFRRPLHAPRSVEDDRVTRITEDDVRHLASA